MLPVAVCIVVLYDVYFISISSGQIRISQNGSTALFLASQENHIQIVKILLAAGANVHLKNMVIFCSIPCNFNR